MPLTIRTRASQLGLTVSRRTAAIMSRKLRIAERAP